MAGSHLTPIGKKLRSLPTAFTSTKHLKRLKGDEGTLSYIPIGCVHECRHEEDDQEPIVSEEG